VADGHYISGISATLLGAWEKQFLRLCRHIYKMGRHQWRGTLTERDRCTLRIVSKNYRNTAAQVTVELNINLKDYFHKNY
jgi:hypothetical protein